MIYMDDCLFTHQIVFEIIHTLTKVLEPRFTSGWKGKLLGPHQTKLNLVASPTRIGEGSLRVNLSKW